MLDLIKRQGISFYLTVGVVVLSIVGFITMLMSSGTQGYAISNLALTVVAVIVAVLASVAGLYLADKQGGHSLVVAVLSLVACVLLTYAFSNILLNRAELVSALFTYDAVNTIGWGVFYKALVAMICFLVSAVLVIVIAFTGKNKKAE